MFPRNCRVDPGSVDTNVGMDIVLCFCAGERDERERGGKERGGQGWRANKEGRYHQRRCKDKQKRIVFGGDVEDYINIFAWEN